MKRIVLTRSGLLLTMVLTACSGGGAPVLPPSQSPVSDQVWPQAPAAPRIAWVASFEKPEDLGIEKGFFGRLGTLIFGEEEVRIVQPMAVAAFNNVIYVADPGVKAVHRFDMANRQHSLVRLADDQPLMSPVALAHDDKGNIYIADSALAGVYRLANNEDVAKPFILSDKPVRPTGLVMDSSNQHLFVVDTGSHKILKYNLSGKVVKSIGRRGDGKAEFNFPTMIWRAANGDILVTDSLNFRIQQFTENGKFVSMFGRHGDGSGNLSRPKGVATDRHGHIYVVDSLFHAVQIFDSKGRLLLGFGSQGQERGEFWLPTGMFIGAGNTIYVADSHNHRIQVFRYVGGQS